MSVAVHNPSAGEISQASFAVPHGHYKVEFFNKSTQALEDATASVICNHDNLENGETIKSCFMHVDLETGRKDISVLQLTYDETQDLESPMEEFYESMSIKEGDLQLEYTGSDESKLFFKLINKETGLEENLDFSLKYWASFVQYLPNGHQNSGDYIFRPIKGEYQALTYSKFVKGTVSKGETKEQMDFYFAADNKVT